MIAALPMYDRPETAGAYDAFWEEIRAALGFGPQALTRDVDVWSIWTSPDLLLAQTCGLPFRARLHAQVTYVATPDFDLTGCAAGHYNSVIIARQDDARDLADLLSARVIANERLSQSGHAALRHHATEKGLTVAEISWSGSHRSSLIAVAEGRADLAAIDAKTWLDATRFDPETRALRIVARTSPTPALPLITAQPDAVPDLRAALAQALDALPAPHRDVIGITGFPVIPTKDYLAVPTPAACLESDLT